MPQMGRRVLQRHIWDCAACLCPIKRTPGLNELICAVRNLLLQRYTWWSHELLFSRYFKVLVQEMQVKVDQGFLNNIIELFSSGEESSREQEVSRSTSTIS